MNLSYKNLYLIIFIGICSFVLSAMQEQCDSEESNESFVNLVLSNLNWPDQAQLEKEDSVNPMQCICPLSECREVFETVESLHEHVREHMLKFYHELQETDDKAAANEPLLNESHNNHELKLGSIIKYTCNLCPKPTIYTSPGWYHAHLLKKHGIIYWPKLSYSCGNCKKTFKMKKSYDSHPNKCRYRNKAG